MMITGRAASDELRPGSPLASRTRAKQAFLGIDRIVQNLSTVLARAGARKVEATVSNRTARLVVDEEMEEAFATLGNVVGPGAAISIHGSLVQIDTGERQEHNGCAVLSVSVTGGQGAKMGVRDALSAVRGMIAKHSGLLRFWTRPGEMRFSFYLPVLR
jgi:hypothetical protein